jgi:hypothetical protein
VTIDHEFHKFYSELKKIYFMGSELQPGVMRAQKREIQICRITKNLNCTLSSFYMKLKDFFRIIQKTYSTTYFTFYELKVFLRIRNTF